MEGETQALLRRLDQDVNGRVAQALAKDEHRELTQFAELTGGRLRPEFAHAPRFAGHLAVGEVAIEPALGPVRVAGIQQEDDQATITWKDDYGISTASARYGVEQVLFVRIAGHAIAWPSSSRSTGQSGAAATSRP